MKDAMDTYFEEKKERDRQRQVERQKDKKTKISYIELFFTYYLRLFWWGSVITLTEYYLGTFSGIPGIGIVIFNCALRIPLVLIINSLRGKQKYSSAFYFLLWVQLLLILADFFYLSDEMLAVILLALSAQILFMLYHYRNKKLLFPTEKQTEEERQP
ncbi:MAG: hypothetical protein Q4B50_07470 [Bacillota bacterium]|nr:hypothetical protein [Bacillota bacterium]